MTGMKSVAPSFGNALLNTPHFDSEVAINMGATINQITGYMFSKMEFLVPCKQEQQAIGSSFDNLNHLIALHQRTGGVIIFMLSLWKSLGKRMQNYLKIRVTESAQRQGMSLSTMFMNCGLS